MVHPRKIAVFVAAWTLLTPHLAVGQLSEEAIVAKFSEQVLSPLVLGAADCNAADTATANAELVLTDAEKTQSRTLHGPWGLPAPSGSVSNEAPVINREYVVNYDSDLFIPTWAAYELKKDQVVSLTRRDCFRPDPRLAAAQSATLHDYEEPVFDRGHIVPRADMNRTKSVMINTFVLTNMAPQHDNFNQGVWEKLESFVRAWAVKKDKVYILTGALFDEDQDGVRDADGAVDRVKPNRLGIATHFYKIVLSPLPNGDIESIAILLAHADAPPKNANFNTMRNLIKSGITSIDKIEASAGYDFFPDMPAPTESAVESLVAADLWPVN